MADSPPQTPQERKQTITPYSAQGWRTVAVEPLGPVGAIVAAAFPAPKTAADGSERYTREAVVAGLSGGDGSGRLGCVVLVILVVVVDHVDI